MKKVMGLLLIIAMISSMVACGNKSGNQGTSLTPTGTTTTAPTQTVATTAPTQTVATTAPTQGAGTTSTAPTQPANNTTTTPTGANTATKK